ncbi:hypothetical protein [Nocardia testacea]|uniref:hypothetical protein n=1 Tax=Nocardia testacea TaxID=248551 RepID=UPI0033F230EB
MAAVEGDRQHCGPPADEIALQGLPGDVICPCRLSTCSISAWTPPASHAPTGGHALCSQAVNVPVSDDFHNQWIDDTPAGYRVGCPLDTGAVEHRADESSTLT